MARMAIGDHGRMGEAGACTIDVRVPGNFAPPHGLAQARGRCPLCA